MSIARWYVLAAWLASMPVSMARSAPVPPTVPDAPLVDTIDITTASAVSFGGDGSDQFGIEAASGDSVVALVTPLAEDCTLRFPILVGETLRLRASSDTGSRAVCELALVSVVNASTARFAYACRDEAWDNDAQKCPAATEATPENITSAQ